MSQLSPHSDEQLFDTLKQRFGHESFRPMQQDIVRDALNQRDTMVIMPTGGGKSVCYQLPAVMRDGLTLVISPLIALMQDQVKALEANGIRATVLNSTVDARDIADREQRAAQGEYDLLYMAPERLNSAAGQRLLSRIKPAMLAIDEAHCISEWGHDFRPDYRTIGSLRKQFPNLPTMALTATATLRVADDIVAQLNLQNPAIYRGSFERTNLHYQVRPKKKMFEQIHAYLESHPNDEGIIYCSSRKKTEDIAERLRINGIDALAYHAGMDHQQRHDNQHAFVYGEARVMVATIAFGMGIDKPDVRFVIHADMPRHMEGYYQETGRAGRDGAPANCILFYSGGDRARIEQFITEKPTEHERELATTQLKHMVSYVYATGCRCIPMLGYFDEIFQGPCNHCDNCTDPLDQQDVTEDARKLLSTIARTGQRFGQNHVINVLRRSKAQQILSFQHDQLSVYGLGEHQPAAYWIRLIDTLTHAGQLRRATDPYPMLALTEESMPVLRGEQPVQMAVPRITKTKAAAKVQPVGDYDQQLFEKLRALRLKLAREQNVPPYVVFNDASLRDMSGRMPSTLDAFAQVSGVGQHKLDRYGTVFTAAIEDYLQSQKPSQAVQ